LRHIKKERDVRRQTVGEYLQAAGLVVRPPERRAEEAGGRPEPGSGSAEDRDPKKRLELVGQRRDVALVMAEHGLSERRACKLLEVDRISYRYEPKPDRNEELRQKLIELAKQKPRYAYRRLQALLERCWRVNHKRLRRACIGKSTWQCGASSESV